MIIDIYTHIFPNDYYDNMVRVAPRLENLGKRLKAVTKLHDLDERFREMDNYGDYRQVISLPNPPIEDITKPDQGIELSRIANDSMAYLVRKHPDRFAGFVAALSMHNMDKTMDELHRAVVELGAKGVQIFTNVCGKPLDDPQFLPVFEAMHKYELPIWMHPVRTPDTSDYESEDLGRFELWWCFGWPYDTSVAMLRLIFAGIFDKFPGIKIITHHLGGMIPYFDGRADLGLQCLGARTTGEDYSNVLSSLKKPHGEYLRMFFGDTAMFGGFHGTKCGYEYFGADQVVFATDAPLGPIPETLEVIDRLELERPALDQLTEGNAKRLMKL